MATEIVFNKDFDAQCIYVMKVFPTDVPTLWDYFTTSQLLDLWWAPKPWNCETENLNFEEGGIWFYSMNGPNGEKVYSQVKYGEINEHCSFDGIDAFCDENGKIDENFPQTKWLIGFTGVEEGTKLSVNMHFSSTEDMEKQLEMGFEEGFKTGLNQLEEILNNLKI